MQMGLKLLPTLGWAKVFIMKIKCLILSDTHGNGALVARVLRMHRDVDAVFFLGDGLSDIASFADGDTNSSWFFVRGNCDFTTIVRGTEAPLVDSVSFGGVKIVLTHGHMYGAKAGLDGLVSLAEDRGAKLILFGHTHRQTEIYSGGVYYFNPGSLSYSYGSAPSFGLLTVDEDSGEVLLSHGMFL